MFNELERAVLGRDLPEHQLTKGDIGVVVFCYPEGEAYEVEFITGDGMTVAVVTLESSEVRPLADGEILHARRLGPV